MEIYVKKYTSLTTFSVSAALGRKKDKKTLTLDKKVELKFSKNRFA